MEATIFSPRPMPSQKPSQHIKAKSKGFTSNKSIASLDKLSIKIIKLKDKSQTGYFAEIKELKSNIMADTIEEILELLPTMIKLNKF